MTEAPCKHACTGPEVSRSSRSAGAALGGHGGDRRLPHHVPEEHGSDDAEKHQREEPQLDPQRGLREADGRPHQRADLLTVVAEITIEDASGRRDAGRECRRHRGAGARRTAIELSRLAVCVHADANERIHAVVLDVGHAQVLDRAVLGVGHRGQPSDEHRIPDDGVTAAGDEHGRGQVVIDGPGRLDVEGRDVVGHIGLDPRIHLGRIAVRQHGRHRVGHEVDGLLDPGLRLERREGDEAPLPFRDGRAELAPLRHRGQLPQRRGDGRAGDGGDGRLGLGRRLGVGGVRGHEPQHDGGSDEQAADGHGGLLDWVWPSLTTAADAHVPLLI